MSGICWCADPGRTEDEMFQCPSGDAGEECFAHDYLAVGGALRYGLDPALPIPDVTRFAAAITTRAFKQGGEVSSR